LADRRLPPSLTEDDTSAPIGDAPRWVLRHLLAAIAAFLAAVVLGVLLPARTEWVAGALLSVASVGVVASVARRYAQCRLGLSRRALSYLRWALFFIACFGLPGRWLVGSGAAVALLVWTFVDRRRVESLRARASDVLDAAGTPASEPAPDHPGAHVDRRVQTPAGVRILATPDVGWLAAPAEDLADRGRIAWAAAHYRALVGPQDARPELARVLRAFALLRHPNGTALMRVSGGEDLVVVTVDVHPRAEALRAARRAGTPPPDGGELRWYAERLTDFYVLLPTEVERARVPGSPEWERILIPSADGTAGDVRYLRAYEELDALVVVRWSDTDLAAVRRCVPTVDALVSTLDLRREAP
jgi:hypothetical protein